jgi:hypothetical protein
VLQAVRWNIPVLVLIRNPVDAISSAFIAEGGKPAMILVHIARYIDFYRPLFGYLDQIVLARFEDVTGCEFARVVAALNRKFGTAFNVDFDEQMLSAQTRDGLLRSAPNRNDPCKSPLPAAERAERVVQLRPLVAAHPAVPRTLELYHRIVRLARK